MRNIINVILLANALYFANTAKSIGVGVSLFGPTGITFKTEEQSGTAIDGTIAWSSDDHYDMILLQSQYLISYDELFYFGLGLRLIHLSHNSDHIHYYHVHKKCKHDCHHYHDDHAYKSSVVFYDHHHGHGDATIIAGRFPAGIRYKLPKMPQLELFAELAIMLDLIPSVAGGIDLGLGARYFF